MFGVIKLGMTILKPIFIDSEAIDADISNKLEKITMMLDDFSKEKVALSNIYEPLPC